MQIASAPLAAAITGTVRRAIATVIADWAGAGASRQLLPEASSTFEVSTGSWIGGGGSGTVPTLATSTTQAHSGVRSMRVTWGTATSFPSIQCNIDGLVVGRTYDFTGWVYVPPGSIHLMIVVATLGVGQATSSMALWQRLTFRFTATATSHILQFWPQTQPVGGELAYVDDVEVRMVPSGYEDLSDYATSISIDRSLTTDLPAEANMVTGYASGQATITLAGHDSAGNPLSRILSAYTGLLGTGQRLGTALAVRLGMVTSDGRELLPAFAGRVQVCAVNDQGGATLTALDGPEFLRTAVTLPVFPAVEPNAAATMANYRAPGLSGSWVIDYVLRRNGIYATPPQRASCAVNALMSGSAWPSTGTLLSAYTYDGATFAPQGAAEFGAHGDGTPGMLHTVISSGSLTRISMGWYSPDPSQVISVNQGSNVFIEIAKFTAWGTGIPTVIDFRATVPGAGPNDSITVNIGRTQMSVGVQRNGVSSSLVVVPGWVNLVAGQTYYIGIHIAMTSTGATVNVRVGATSYAAFNLTVANPTGRPDLTYLGFAAAGDSITGEAGTGRIVALSGVQVTTEAFASTMWNDAFAPAAVLDPSLNPLVAMPAVEEEQPWPLVQEVAAAEQGMVLVDEAGVFRFFNRNRMNPATTAAVAAVTAARALRSVSAEERIETVRNVVRVESLPLYVDAADSIVWSASEVLRVPAGGSLVVPVAFDAGAAAYAIDTSFAYYSGATTAASGSGYRAARNSDGTGGDISNLGIAVVQFPARLELTITNPNAFDAYLVENGLATTTRSQPMLQVVGRLIGGPAVPGVRPATNPVVSLASDALSRNTYGDQAIDVSAGRWRQSVSAAVDLAAALLARMKDPHPVLSDVSVVSDGRLQLGDRITLIEAKNVGVIRDYWIVGKTDRFSASGSEQTYTLREAGLATTGMDHIMVWDSADTWDSLAGWAA